MMHNLIEAFTKAIKDIGLDNFKKTSLFGRNCK